MSTSDGEQKTPTKSLPGFLRRSLRMNYSDDQEEKEESSSAPATNGAANDKNANTERRASPPAITRRKETEKQKSEAEDTTVSVEPRPSAKNLSSNNIPKPTHQTLERTISYKQAMFEKAIGADVVSMSDLRRLGWNGIPVRINIA